MVQIDEKSAPYQPFGAALEIWKSRAPEILAVGPARTGKSRGLLEKAHYCAQRYAKSRILLLRKTRGSMSESILQTYEDEVLPQGHPLLNGSQRRTRQVYLYPNGSRIIPAGMDDPQKVMSTEYDLIFAFESLEFSRNDYEVVTTRLSNTKMPYRQILLDCNPGSPMHWIRRAMLKREFAVFESTHKDNPRFYDHKLKAWKRFGVEYLNRLRRLTGVRYKRLFKGLWVAAEGVIYELTEKNLTNRAAMPKQWKGQLPKSWRRIRAVDFGYTKPFCCQWWAIDPDGRMYLYREIYMTRRLVRDHAALINILSVGENIDTTVCDWDAEGRADLESNGIPTTPAYKGWSDGRDAVQARMRLAGDGKPRLLFLEDALVEPDPELKDIGHPLQTREEFDSYVYKRITNAMLDKPSMDKEEPIDEYDHGMDTMRYAVSYVDRIGSGEIQIKGDSALIVERQDIMGTLQRLFNNTNTVKSGTEGLNSVKSMEELAEDFMVYG